MDAAVTQITVVSSRLPIASWVAVSGSRVPRCRCRSTTRLKASLMKRDRSHASPSSTASVIKGRGSRSSVNTRQNEGFCAVTPSREESTAREG